jgi:hypothetical protein
MPIYFNQTWYKSSLGKHFVQPGQKYGITKRYMIRPLTLFTLGHNSFINTVGIIELLHIAQKV